MKIVIFGTGNLWEKTKFIIKKEFDIICFLDNNEDKIGKTIDLIKIVHPSSVFDYEYDAIVLMSIYDKEMKSQLIDIGVQKSKIFNWKQFRERYMKDIFFSFGCDKSVNADIMIFTTEMGYNGGTIAITYAADVLQRSGKKIQICTEFIDNKLLEELKEQYQILVAPSIPYIGDELRKKIYGCEMVIVNVFQMLPIIVQINKIKPVLWWIHEPAYIIKSTIEEYPQYNDKEYFSKANIRAVSSIPLNNFNNYFPERIKRTMAYGIPDELDDENFLMEENKIITFGIIGLVYDRKAQDIFVEAIKKLSEQEKNKSKFMIIGSYGKSQFSINLLESIKNMPNVVMTGLLSRADMKRVYKEIDVVVCPSREDPLPIVMTEAMMYKKVCIASDRTGTSDYIVDGENGFVCKTGDATNLCEKMRYLIANPKEIVRIGENGRKIYDQYFTMESFGERIEEAISETINLYSKNFANK